MRHEITETATFTKIYYTCDSDQEHQIPELLPGYKPRVCLICDRDLCRDCMRIISDLSCRDLLVCPQCYAIRQSFIIQMEQAETSFKREEGKIKQSWKEQSRIPPDNEVTGLSRS